MLECNCYRYQYKLSVTVKWKGSGNKIWSLLSIACNAFCVHYKNLDKMSTICHENYCEQQAVTKSVWEDETLPFIQIVLFTFFTVWVLKKLVLVHYQIFFHISVFLFYMRNMLMILLLVCSFSCQRWREQRNRTVSSVVITGVIGNDKSCLIKEDVGV